MFQLIKTITPALTLVNLLVSMCVPKCTRAIAHVLSLRYAVDTAMHEHAFMAGLHDYCCGFLYDFIMLIYLFI